MGHADGTLVLSHQSTGGQPVWHVEDPLDLFDSATGAWSSVALPTPRTSLGVTAVGPLVLFAGGLVEKQPVDTVDIFDTRTRSWTVAKLSSPRERATGVTVGSKALLLGETIDIFDAETGAWSTTVPPRPWTVAPTVVGTQAVFTSQYNAEGDGPTPVDVYDAATGAWRSEALSIRREAFSIASVGTKVLFAGGGQLGVRRTANKEIDVVDIYDTATGAWTTGQLHLAREIPKTAVVAGKVLFIGGQFGCFSCPATTLGAIVDIYDSTA